MGEGTAGIEGGEELAWIRGSRELGYLGSILGQESGQDHGLGTQMPGFYPRGWGPGVRGSRNLDEKGGGRLQFGKGPGSLHAGGPSAKGWEAGVEQGRGQEPRCLGSILS